LAEPSADPSGIASSSPPATAATSAPARTTPIERLAGLAMLLQQEAETGRLRPKAAKALLRDLEGVVRALDAGRTTEAAERFAEFRERVSELREDRELADAALPDLDEIGVSLRAG
jgi:serine/threonine-protein kinase